MNLNDEAVHAISKEHVSSEAVCPRPLCARDRRWGPARVRTQIMTSLSASTRRLHLFPFRGDGVHLIEDSFAPVKLSLKHYLFTCVHMLPGSRDMRDTSAVRDISNLCGNLFCYRNIKNSSPSTLFSVWSKRMHLHVNTLSSRFQARLSETEME